MPDTEGWVVLLASPRRWVCHDRALVLQAMGIPCVIADGPRNAALLLVPPGDLERARAQLRLYEAENLVRDAGGADWQRHGSGIPGAAAYAGVLVLAFVLQSRYWRGVDWLEAGALDGLAVRHGEWWRVVTALTLHADAGHLAANLVFGVFFGVFAGQYLGAGLAWATIVAAAAAGNAADILLLPPSHQAIGASTAVFAALGLVAAFVWLTEARRALGWARRWAPIVGAVVLLAYIGTGDSQTDAVAHLTGFAAGFAAGAGLGLRPPRLARSRWLQAGLGALAAAVVAACWWLAAMARGAGLA